MRVANDTIKRKIRTQRSTQKSKGAAVKERNGEKVRKKKAKEGEGKGNWKEERREGERGRGRTRERENERRRAERDEEAEGVSAKMWMGTKRKGYMCQRVSAYMRKKKDGERERESGRIH